MVSSSSSVKLDAVTMQCDSSFDIMPGLQYN